MRVVLEVFGATMLLVLVAGGILYEYARACLGKHERGNWRTVRL
jgi:hypothetical protein